MNLTNSVCTIKNSFYFSLFENKSLLWSYQSGNHIQILAVQFKRQALVFSRLNLCKRHMEMLHNCSCWISLTTYQWMVTFRLRSTVFWTSRNSDAVEWQMNTSNRSKTSLKHLKCSGSFLRKRSHIGPKITFVDLYCWSCTGIYSVGTGLLGHR